MSLHCCASALTRLRLVVTEGPRQGAQLRLEHKDALVVGSSPLADLQLPAPGVAGVHVRLLRRAEGWTCVDVSGRGFAVGGRLTSEASLRAGDLVRLGEHGLQVLSDERRPVDAPLEAPPPPPPPPEVTGPALVAVEGNDAGKRFALDAAGPMIMGRGATTHITLWDIRASRAHARVDPVPGGFVVQDLGSSNGTWLNGERLVDPRPLAPGDRIQIGSTVLVFQPT